MSNQRNTTYEQRLTNHIDTYLTLVNNNPSVRYNEFHALVDYAQLNNVQTILEMPAEGKILEHFYPDASISRADIIPINNQHHRNYAQTDWSLTSINNNAYDAILSLAPIHHANAIEKQQYLDNVFRCLKSGGVFAFGEVELASDLSIFLDQFVHQHSLTGHQGEYPTQDLENNIAAAGFTNITSKRIRCDWTFESEHQMATFITQLFRVNPMPEQHLLSQLRNILGYTVGDKQVHLHWQLLFFRAVKA